MSTPIIQERAFAMIFQEVTHLGKINQGHTSVNTVLKLTNSDNIFVFLFQCYWLKIHVSCLFNSKFSEILRHDSHPHASCLFASVQRFVNKFHPTLTLHKLLSGQMTWLWRWQNITFCVWLKY